MESLLPIIVFIIFMALQALASRKPKKTVPEQELPGQDEVSGRPEDPLHELREILFGDQPPAPRPAPPPIPQAPLPAPPAPARPSPKPKFGDNRLSFSPKASPLKKAEGPRSDRAVEILEEEIQPTSHPMLARLQSPETVRDVVVMSELLQRRRR